MKLKKSDALPCSILVPVYNAEKHIRLHLPSILLSARAFDQVVIIDDGSDDRTLQTLKEYAVEDSRIEILSREHLGLVQSLNYGLQSCAHELIARADIDDIYPENRISSQVSHMAQSSDVGATFTDYRIWTENSIFLGEIVSAIYPSLTQLSLITSSRTPHPGVMFRKSLLQEVGGYRREDFPAEDLALWIRMSKISKIDSLPIPLLDYTLSPHGISARNQLEMSSKLTSLRLELVQSLDLLKLIEESSMAAKSYSDVQGSNARKLALIRDLYILSKFIEGSRKRKVLQVIPHLLLSLDSSSLRTAHTMHTYRKMREKYRKGYFR